MAEAIVRSLASYPWALASGPWAARRIVNVDVHVSVDSVRLQPLGRHARRAPALVIPRRLIVGADCNWAGLWIRTADSDDPVGLSSRPRRIIRALQAVEVPIERRFGGRRSGWSRPGCLAQAVVTVALLVLLLVARDEPWWDPFQTGVVAAWLAWWWLGTARGPDGGRRLVLSDAGWVEDVCVEPAPAESVPGRDQ